MIKTKEIPLGKDAKGKDRGVVEIIEPTPRQLYNLFNQPAAKTQDKTTPEDQYAALKQQLNNFIKLPAGIEDYLDLSGSEIFEIWEGFKELNPFLSLLEKLLQQHFQSITNTVIVNSLNDSNIIAQS